MVPQPLYGITLGQLDIFFLATKYRSFTKAAAALNMTQSAVSKSIARLEDSLGFPLFFRRYREIVPTESALQLYSRWKQDISSLSRTYEEILRSQTSAEPHLRLGAAGTTNLSSYFWPLVARFSQKHAEVHLEFDSDNINRLIEKLLYGQLDLIFIPDFMYYTIEKNNFAWKWAAKDHAQVWLHSEHPLVNQTLTMDSLKNEKIAFLDENTPDNERWLRQLFESRNMKLNAGQTFSSPEVLVKFYSHLYSGEITFSDNFFELGQAAENFVKKPILDVENGIICAWNPGKEFGALTWFLSIM